MAQRKAINAQNSNCFKVSFFTARLEIKLQWRIGLILPICNAGRLLSIIQRIKGRSRLLDIVRHFKILWLRFLKPIKINNSKLPIQSMLHFQQ